MKKQNLHRHGWNDGVDIETSIKILDDKKSYKIAVITGAAHSERLVKILTGQGFKINEALSITEKTRFEIPVTNKENINLEKS